MHAPKPKFKTKSNFPLPFRGSSSTKKPVPYGTDQGWFDEAVRTSGGSELVGPTGFTGSGSVLVTLVLAVLSHSL
jgi:hypothetical protein